MDTLSPIHGGNYSLGLFIEQVWILIDIADDLYSFPPDCVTVVIISVVKFFLKPPTVIFPLDSEAFLGINILFDIHNI